MINIKFWLFNCSSVTYKWVDVTNTLTGYMHNWKTNFHVYPSHPYLIKLYLVSFSTFCILQTIDDVVNRCIPAVFPQFLLFLSLLILFDFYQFFSQFPWMSLDFLLPTQYFSFYHYHCLFMGVHDTLNIEWMQRKTPASLCNENGENALPISWWSCLLLFREKRLKQKDFVVICLCFVVTMRNDIKKIK